MCAYFILYNEQMANLELDKYVSEARANGLTDDAIRQELLKAGWNPGEVEGVFSLNVPISPNTQKVGAFPNLSPTPNQVGRRSLIITIIVVLVVILSAGASVYFFFFKNNTHSAPAPDSNKPAAKVATPTQSYKQIPSDWKTYKNPEWGFQISYPPQYRFLDNVANSKGPLHYLIPQKPPAESGNYGTLVEIANVTGTSTVKGILQMVVSAQQAKSIDELNSQIQALVTSNTDTYKNSGTSVSQSKVNIDSQDFPAVHLQSSSGTETHVYYLQPPTEIYGKQQPPRIFMFTYTPEDDEIFSQIVSTLKSIPVVPSDAVLFMSATKNKDTFWCDKIANSNLKDQCYIEVRGPIYDSFPIDFSSIPHDSGGTGGVVSGTTLSINGGKGSNVFLAGAISNKTNMNYIEFDVDMINGEQAQSLLTVYLNTTKLGMVDGRLQSGQEHYRFPVYLDVNPNKNPYQPDPVVPGLYTLSFRLDTFADGAASAQLSNIKGGLMH